MKTVICYLLCWIVTLGLLAFCDLSKHLPEVFGDNVLWLRCAICGALGGVLYCLRAVYLNACVRKAWDKDWEIWYYIRPLASLICGLVSLLFLKAGLLILESGQKSDSTSLGFYAFAFVAGLNVDKFVSKIEDIAQATWGIEKSRQSFTTTETPTKNEKEQSNKAP